MVWWKDVVCGDSLTPRATSAQQEENAQTKASKTKCDLLLPMVSTAARPRDAASHCGAAERNKGFLGTAKFHLIQGVFSHMGGKEVGREGGIRCCSSINLQPRPGAL